MRRLRGWAIAGLLTVLLSGCVSIPRSGPVVPGRAMGDDPREGVFQVIPEGPRAGVGPLAIVTVFLRAAAGYSDDHRVARSFLAPNCRLRWRPDASVTVYPGEASVRSTISQLDGRAVPSGTAVGDAQSAEVTVSVPVQATIDDDGRYALAPPRQTATARFSLVRLGGQWRIDRLADGIAVTASDFGATFRAFPVYFPDLSGSFLVPDVRWFPGTREAPTALVRALLDGPAPWLRGAVTTGAPPGTQMAVAAVTVTGDVATVDLNEQVRAASGLQRRLLAAQLQGTLGRLRTIRAVRITVRRADFDIPQPAAAADDGPPADRLVHAQVDPQVDPEPVLLDLRGQVSRLQGSTLVPVRGLAGLGVPGASHPAVSSDSSAYAVLGPGGGRVLEQLPGTQAASVMITGAALTPPSFDPQGWVWSAPGANAGTVYAARTGAPLAGVWAPWLAGQRVVAMRASRDGARMLVAVRRPGARGGAAAFVAGVVRDSQGRPRALTAPLSLVPDLVSVLDAAWVDEDRVVLLGVRGGQAGGPLPWLVQVGGGLTATSPPPGAVSIAAGNGEYQLLAGAGDRVLNRVGAGWQPLAAGRWPAFAG